MTVQELYTLKFLSLGFSPIPFINGNDTLRPGLFNLLNLGIQWVHLKSLPLYIVDSYRIQFWLVTTVYIARRTLCLRKNCNNLFGKVSPDMPLLFMSRILLCSMYSLSWLGVAGCSIKDVERLAYHVEEGCA